MHPYHIQQLFNCFHEQQEQLRKIEQMLKELRAEINTLRQGNQKTIERVEYNFDLLKIERLEGTLNIGLTPTEGKGIDDIDIGEQYPVQNQMPGPQDNLYSDIHQEVWRHLDQEVPGQINRLVSERRMVLGDQYASVIIEDIRKQLGERISLYLQKYQTKSDSAISENEIRQTIVQQIKKEIEVAVERHIRNLNQGKGDQHENDGRE